MDIVEHIQQRQTGQLTRFDLDLGPARRFREYFPPLTDSLQARGIVAAVKEVLK